MSGKQKLPDEKDSQGLRVSERHIDALFSRCLSYEDFGLSGRVKTSIETSSMVSPHGFSTPSSS